MPKILNRLVSQLKEKGYSEKAARAIATSQLQKAGNLKKGTAQATKKGKQRGNMTAAQRAIDRAAKLSGKPKSQYTYNPKTNRATLKRT